MATFTWVALGLIIGFIARWIVPGEAPGGTIPDIIVGIVGAVIGGWLYSLIAHAGLSEVNLPGLVYALIGAVILLRLMRAIGGRSAT